MKSKYVCPKCGLTWTQKDRKDPEACLRCHEWVHPVDEKEEAKK